MVVDLDIGALVVLATVAALVAWFGTGLTGTSRITSTLVVWVVAFIVGVVVSKLLGKT